MNTSWISGKKTTPFDRFSCLSLKFRLSKNRDFWTYLNHWMDLVCLSNSIQRFCHLFHGRLFFLEASFVRVPRIEVEVSTSCCKYIALFRGRQKFSENLQKIFQICRPVPMSERLEMKFEIHFAEVLVIFLLSSSNSFKWSRWFSASTVTWPENRHSSFFRVQS